MKFDLPRVIHDLSELQNYPKRYQKVGFIRKRFELIYYRTRASEEQNHRCCWCGIKTVEEPGFKHSATLEHIIPRVKGGRDTWDNFAMACAKHNSKRGHVDALDYWNQLFPDPNHKSKRQLKRGRRKDRKYEELHQDPRIVWG